MRLCRWTWRRRSDRVLDIDAYHLYLVLKLILVAQCSFLDTGPVVVDGVDAVVQKLCDLRTVVDAQPDERKDTEGGAELSVLFNDELCIGTEQGVDVVDEMRKEVDAGTKGLIGFGYKTRTTGFIGCPDISSIRQTATYKRAYDGHIALHFVHYLNISYFP